MTAHYIAALGQRAILYEVSTTPKPGLVDRLNSGSHRDMDFFTFMASSSALYRGMYECAKLGLEFRDEDRTRLLDRVRIPGIRCEEEMFKATNGVNTHKGIIFSLGILCAVSGMLLKKHEQQTPNEGTYLNKSSRQLLTAEELCSEVKAVTRNLTLKDFKGIENKKSLTHGENLYLKYGFKGIRGEVESGFKTVRENSLSIIRERGSELSLNNLFLEVLLSLMSVGEDTNIIIRGGIESLDYMRKTSRDFILAGGMKQPKAIEKLEIMNHNFVQKNISPGGSADLLAVSIFLGMIEGVIK